MKPLNVYMGKTDEKLRKNQYNLRKNGFQQNQFCFFVVILRIFIVET